MHHHSHTDDHYDIIVIGSGMGGLSAASLLAQLAGKRVLVLERHFKLGGFTHTFTRQGYSWDVGLHYVGQMAEGAQPRRIFDLVTGGAVSWHRMPHLFERFCYPSIQFAVPADPAAYQAALCARYPTQATAIARYFSDVERAARWIARHSAGKLMPRPARAALEAVGKGLALQTTQTYLDRNFSDPQLKSLLVSQWGDYGVPPAYSAFGIHALIVAHYLDGAYYPVGGAATIAQAIEPIIAAAGGACLVNCEVAEILVDAAGKATGVRVAARNREPERRYHAPVIISNAGAYITYGRLLPPTLNLPQQRELAALPEPLGSVSVYLGLHTSPTTVGLTGENLWCYAQEDHAAGVAVRNRLLEGKAAFTFASFSSLHDATAGKNSAQLISWADYAAFRQWREQNWRRRDEKYDALKTHIATSMLDLVERYVPGFGALIDYVEVSTPLTVEHFTGHHHGAIYGVPAVPQRFRGSLGAIKTPVPGLYITGADVVSPGIVGAMMGGVFTTAAVLGLRTLPKILSTLGALPSVQGNSPVRRSVA